MTIWRARAFAVLLLTFFTCGLTATAATAADLLLAINKGDNTIAIIDAATLKVLGTAPTGPDPHEVVASADGKLAYITNYNAGNGYANSISVVDLAARKALRPIDIGALGRPHGITIAGGKIYFTAEGAKVVGRYDPAGLLAAVLQSEQAQLRERRCLLVAENAKNAAFLVKFVENDVHPI